MRVLWSRVWLRYTTLALVIVAVATTVLVVGRDGADTGHLVANRAQLRKACHGTLPSPELNELVRGEVAGKLSQHGTLLEPGQESRSLLDCSLSWGAGRSVAVHAEALVSGVPEELQAEDVIGTGVVENSYAAPGITGGYGSHGAWLVAECRNGLTGRVRSSTDLYVTARVTRGQGTIDRTEALTEFRTATQVANAVTSAESCGDRPLKVPTAIVAPATSSAQEGRWQQDDEIADPRRDLPKCRWIGHDPPTGMVPGTWGTYGDLLESPLMSGCEGQWDQDAARNVTVEPKEWQVDSVSVTSWAGVLGRSAFQAYQGDNLVPDGPDVGERPDAEHPEAIQLDDGDPPRLALWATSVCGGRLTYHRIVVTPKIIEDSGEVWLAEKDRTRLSSTADQVLDRYLDAAGGWPKSAGCQDTKVLGEVEEWH